MYETKVKLWNVGNNDDEPSCLSTFSIPSRRVDVISFHPTADQVCIFNQNSLAFLVLSFGVKGMVNIYLNRKEQR